MKSEKVRLWPVEDGEIIFQNHPHFDNYKWANDRRLAALGADDAIRIDTCDIWHEQGIEVEASRNDPYLISSVKLDFADEEWVDLCNKDGELLPACCANISAIRDVLIDALRNGGFVSCDDLEEAARLYKEHHEMDDNDPIKIKLVDLWENIKPFSDRQAIPHTNNVDSIEDACSIIHNLSNELRYSFLLPPEDKRVEDALALLKAIPAVKVLYEKIQKDFPEVQEAFAVCKNGEIIETIRANGIYINKEFSQAVAKTLAEVDSESSYDVRPVKISLEDGIVFGNPI
jgi:hypothetical protein